MTYEDEVTEWTMDVAGEETIEGVDCWLVEATFDEEPFRYANPSGAPTKVLSLTYAISKDTLDVIQGITQVEVMGMELTSTQTHDYGTADHGQPFSVGDSCSKEVTTEIDPPMYEATTSAIDIEVTGKETVTVPAGEFECFKVELTSDGELQDEEWYAVNYDMILPVKGVRHEQYKALETRELVSYDPMPHPKTTEPACQTLYWFDDTTTECGQKEFCGAYMYQGLQTFETLEACQEALDAGDGDGQETPEPDIVGTSWVYEVDYAFDGASPVTGNELQVANVTDWTTTVTGMETLEGVDCYVTESSVDGDAKRRYPYPGGVTPAMDVPVVVAPPPDYVGPTIHRSMEHGNIIREVFPLRANAMGGINLNVARDYAYTGAPAELSEGDTWTYTSDVALPEFMFEEHMDWEAEVVGIETVDVLMGSYECYKIKTTGSGGELPTEAVNYYWWAVDEDYLCPVKYQYNYIFLGSETKELKSYTPAQ